MASTPQPPWSAPRPESWPETLTDGGLRRIWEAWQALPYDRQRFASEVADRAQRRIDALTCEVLVCPDVRERAEREVQPWIALRNVGLALVDLAALDRAFHAGQLCSAKLEVLARVVGWEHEAAWIAKARALDVRSLAPLALHSPPGGPPIEAAMPEGVLDADEVASAFGMRDGSPEGLERELVGIAYGAACSAPSRRAVIPTATPRTRRNASCLSRAAAGLVTSVRRLARRLDPRAIGRTLVGVPTGHGLMSSLLGAARRLCLRVRDLPNVRRGPCARLSTA